MSGDQLGLMTVSTALYRRYRPDAFSELIGQEHVTEPLMAALTKNRVNHAYLFSGPRGCGKTTSARILARCLNCLEGPTPNPCGTCPSCVDLATGGQGSLDVVEIDAASHGGVDDARDLRERATFAPARDRYKIFIIDEAHMVTNQGFNALLKIVEEPPEHLKFIFATTEPDKVIGTIRSRTHHYPFRLVPPETMQNYLGALTASENMEAEPGVFSLVIRAGGGSVRDTLSVLDQLMAGSPDSKLEYDRAVDLLGFTHAGLLDDVVDALATQDSGTLFRMVDHVVQSGQDPRRFVEDLLERFRDLIIIRAVPENPGQVLHGIPKDVLARMEVQAHNLGPAQLSLAADITNDALTAMVGATSPRLQLELLMARLLLPAAEVTQQSLAARLDRIESHLAGATSEGFAPSSPASSPADSAPAETVAQPTPQARSAADVRAMLAKKKETAPEPVEETAQKPTPKPEEPKQEPVSEESSSSPVPSFARPERQAPKPIQQPEPTPEPVLEPAPESVPAPETPEPEPQPEPQTQEAESTSEQQPEEAETASVNQVEKARRLWPEIIQDIAGQSRILWMIAKDHTAVAGFDGSHLVVNFSNDGARNTFLSRGGEQLVQQLALKHFGTECTVDFISGSGDFPAPKAPEAQPSTKSMPAPSPQLEQQADTGLGPEPDWSKPEPPVSWDAEPSPEETPEPTPEPTAEPTPEPEPVPEPAPVPEPVVEPVDDSTPEKPFGSAPIPSFARPAAEIAEESAAPSFDREPQDQGETKPKRISRFQQMMAAQRAEAKPEPVEEAPVPEDPEDFVPSDDDEEVDSSSTRGRAALEKVLGARLIEERRPGQESRY